MLDFVEDKNDKQKAFYALKDDEIVGPEHFAGPDENQIQPITNDKAIGKTAGECRGVFKGYQFFRHSDQRIFAQSFDFLGDILGTSNEKE